MAVVDFSHRIYLEIEICEIGMKTNLWLPSFVFLLLVRHWIPFRLAEQQEKLRKNLEFALVHSLQPPRKNRPRNFSRAFKPACRSHELTAFHFVAFGVFLAFRMRPSLWTRVVTYRAWDWSVWWVLDYFLVEDCVTAFIWSQGDSSSTILCWHFSVFSRLRWYWWLAKWMYEINLDWISWLGALFSLRIFWLFSMWGQSVHSLRGTYLSQP